MISISPHRATGLALVLTAAALGLTGCGKEGYQTEPVPPPPTTISAEAAGRLCGILDGQKGTWKSLGPQVAQVAFTGVMNLWTIDDTVAGAAVAYNRDLVDTATTRACPQVRSAVLKTLGVPEFRAALGGF
ncbi:hypothetical protein ACFWUP_23900 [Nocardia sp. NPDC058658]|uniref:hypothetical protein n=1 Tax=Nocardia sp. NPDC058658 TaxID=3346580 RepID=UPI00365E7583